MIPGPKIRTRVTHFVLMQTVLAVERELGATILLPASICLVGAELTFLAVADYTDTTGSDASFDQCGLGSVGTVFAEGDVVLRRSVGDRYRPVRRAELAYDERNQRQH